MITNEKKWSIINNPNTLNCVSVIIFLTRELLQLNAAQCNGAANVFGTTIEVWAPPCVKTYYMQTQVGPESNLIYNNFDPQRGAIHQNVVSIFNRAGRRKLGTEICTYSKGTQIITGI